ncbi:hypothetical protein TSOC_011488, partial [Tetrabaena socialis]
FGRTMFTMWRAVLGQFNIDWAWGSAWQELSLMFFTGFMFVVQIVLLNMLIALMREIYSRVQHTEEDVFLKGRATLIVEVETLMARKQLERYANMPPYVHLLTPVQRKDARDKSGVEAKLERLEQMLMKLQDALDQGMAGPRGGQAGPGGGGGPVGSLVGGGHGGGDGDVSHINTSALSQEQLNLIQMQAGKLKEMEDQFPAVIRQLDRVQRSVNNQGIATGYLRHRVAAVRPEEVGQQGLEAE